MKAKADPEFWRRHNELPTQVQELARKNYALWLANPFHPSLQSNKSAEAMVGSRWPPLPRHRSFLAPDIFVWDWIGTHEEYNKTLTRMRFMPLLEVKNLKVHFPVKPWMFSRVHEFVKAVDDVSFSIEPGETLGLVGESGCGKTTLGRAIVRLVEPTAGSVLLSGEDITRMGGSELQARRRKFQLIFQDPYSSLNPRMTVEQIVGEALDIHQLTASKSARQKRIAELLNGSASTRFMRNVIRTNSAVASGSASASPAHWPSSRN